MENKETPLHEDRRVRRTKRLLMESLTEIMLKKPVKDITVRELCEKADLNRGTFYIHYRDVFDMLEQLENDFFSRMEEIFNSKQNMLIDNPFPMLVEMYKYIGENSSLCRAVLGKHGDYAFILRLNSLIRERCLQDLKFSLESSQFTHNNAGNFDYIYSFVVSGTLGIVRCWLENGMRETPEALAAVTEQIIIRGIPVK